MKKSYDRHRPVVAQWEIPYFIPRGTVVSGVATWLTFMNPARRGAANTTEDAFVTRLRVNHWMRMDVRVNDQG